MTAKCVQACFYKTFAPSAYQLLLFALISTHGLLLCERRKVEGHGIVSTPVWRDTTDGTCPTEYFLVERRAVHIPLYPVSISGY